jgi:hypothetical protein
MIGIRCILFIFFVVCFFPGSLAIEVSFSAEDGGESVGISDEYDVGTGVSVVEESEAKFGNVEMTNTREVKGSGDISMAQKYSGSDGYVGRNSVLAQDASSTISTCAFLMPATVNAKLSGKIIGESGSLGLNLISNGNSAWTSASMNGGALNTNMAAWTGSASVSQRTDINAESGGAGSWAGILPWSGRQTRASTNVWVQNGILHSVQNAKNDGIASAFQISDISAELGVANSDAGQLQEDASSNYATTFTQINNGILKTKHIAIDEDTASVSQESEMIGERGYADSRAGYFVEYNENIGLVFALAVGSVAQLSNGKISILQTARDGKSVVITQDAYLNAKSGMAYSNIRDSAGNYATTYSSMDQGALTTQQIAEIEDKSRVCQVSTVNGRSAYTTSSAKDANGKNVYTGSSMGSGCLTTMQAAEIDDKTITNQKSEVNAERGSSESYATDGKGNHASTSNHMEYGTLTTEHNAIIDDSVSVSQNSKVNADSGYAASSARNSKGDEARTELGMNYQSDLARKGASTTDQTSKADEYKVIVSQISEVNAGWGSASSYAGNWNDGNYAEISLNMKNGNLKTDQTAKKDGISAMGSQTSEVNAEEGYAGSSAGLWDMGYPVITSIYMKKGNLKSDQTATHDRTSTHASGEIHVAADMINIAESANQGSDHSSITTTVNGVGNVKGTFDGMIASYAGHSTGASQTGRIVGGYEVRGVANDLTKSRKSAYGTFDRIVNVWTDDTGRYINGLSGEWFINPGQLIQPVIDSAEAGDSIELASGIFNENLIVNKLLTLLGAGSGDDTSFNTLINAADKSKPVISIVTGGISEDNRLIVKDLQVTGATSSSGISINGVGDISHITLDNIASTGNYNGADFSALGSGNSISDVVISNSKITNSVMNGVNIDARNHGSIGNVEIRDSMVSDSGGNGVRVNTGVRYSSDKRISGTIGSVGIKGCTISDSGGSGVDIRAYSGSTIGNVEIAGSAISGAGESGVYGGSYYGGTTIGNIGITESTISGCDRGLSMGATDGGINNNIALTDSTISNSRYDGIWTAAANGGTIGKLGITRSTIIGSGWNGVSTKTWSGGTIVKLEAHDSNIYDNSEFGIMNQAGTVFDATNNWWGNGGTGVNAGKPGEEGNNLAGSVLYTPTEAFRRSYGQTTAQTLGVVTYTPWSTSKFPEAP